MVLLIEPFVVFRRLVTCEQGELAGKRWFGMVLRPEVSIVRGLSNAGAGMTSNGCSSYLHQLDTV